MSNYKSRRRSYYPRAGAAYGSRAAATGQVATGGRVCRECDGMPYHASWCEAVK